MDSVKSVFRVILELSNDRASSTVYFMLLAGCMTARTRYLRLKSDSSEVIDALKENEATVVHLDSISGTSVKLYYLDGHHVSVDVTNDTTLKEICDKLLHDTRMGLYEVENEFGPSHEQRLLDADVTIGQLAARWRSRKWPHAKLIAPFYLKGWGTKLPPHDLRHVHFEQNRALSSGGSPNNRDGPSSHTDSQSGHQSPRHVANQATTPERSFSHSPAQSTSTSTPSSASPHRQSRFRSQSPGTAARTRTTDLIDALFNSGEDFRPRVEFINLPPSSLVEVPKPTYGTPPRTVSRSVTMAEASPTERNPEATRVSFSPQKGSPRVTAARRSPAQAARSPALSSSSATPSPSNSGGKSARKHRSRGATAAHALPLRSSSSYTTTLNTVTNARGAYSPVTVIPAAPGSSSSTAASSNSSSNSSPASSTSGRSPESPPQSAAVLAASSSTNSPLDASGSSSTVAPECERTLSCEVTDYASPLRDVATSPILVLGSTPPLSLASASTPPLLVEREVASVPLVSGESLLNANIVSHEKIRPRTTYVQIAGTAASSPAEVMIPRDSYHATGVQTSNVFDLNNSPALLPVPSSPKSPKSQHVSPHSRREDASPTTTGSTHSGASTPGSVSGLSPYPSWRATPSPGVQTFGLDNATPPETINAVLFARLFGRPETNEFTSPRFVAPVNSVDRHTSPQRTHYACASHDANPQSRYSRSSSPAGSVGSACDSVSSGGTRRPRSRSNSHTERLPFDTTYSTPPLSQLIAEKAASADDNDDANEGMVNLMEDLASTLYEGDSVTPLPSEHVARRFLTPQGTVRRKQEPSSVGKATSAGASTAIRQSASRLDRKTSSGTMSESDSSVASHLQTRLPRRSAHNTPASTNPKKNKNNTPASTGTNGHKTKRASVAAFGHGLRSPTSAAIRELFEARKAHNAAANAMPTPEQIAAGCYTQSYAQVHGGYMPTKRVFRPRQPPTTSDNEHSNLDSDNGSLHSARHRRAHAHHSAEGNDAAERHHRRGRSTSPHSVISNTSSRGSRASSANRTRAAHNWVP